MLGRLPFTGGTDAQDPTAKLLGLRMNHGMLPNGGGAKVNQWTMIMDLLWGDQARIVRRMVSALRRAV